MRHASCYVPRTIPRFATAARGQLETYMTIAKLLVGPIAAAFLAAASPAWATPAKNVKGAQVVEIAVTKDGFVPSTVTVKHGKPVQLVVTRKVERTCATDIVSKDLGVNQALPLDKPVTVHLTPKKAGEYRFACAMDMIAGTLKVE